MDVMDSETREPIPISEAASPEMLQRMAVALDEFLHGCPSGLVERSRIVWVEPRPRIYAEESWTVWRFPVREYRGAEHEISVEIGFAAVDEFGPEAVLVAASHCGCFHFQSHEECKHDTAVARWLLAMLTGDPERLQGWLRTLAEGERNRGDALVRQLVQIADDAEPAAEEATRIQWRIRLMPSVPSRPLAIRAVEQRPKKSGSGWTKGREIRPHAILGAYGGSVTDRDRRIASQYRAVGSSYDYRGAPYWDLLPLLCGHPNVAWDDAAAHSMSVEERPLRFVLGQHGDAYRMQVALGDHLLTPCAGEVAVCGHDDAASWVIATDPSSNRLLFGRPANSHVTQWLRQVLRGGGDPLDVSQETAAAITAASGRLARLVEVELPESLAGPAEPLPPEISVLLTPSRQGLEVALRVADPRLPEPLVPGLPPSEVPIAREEGPLRLTRSHREERDKAERIAERLSLGALDFNGEYTWLCPTDDAALRLLEILRELGEAAPPVLWPEGKKIRVYGELTPQSLKVQVEDRRDWFGLSGSLKVDDLEVSLADLLAAVRGGHKYVRVGDNQFARVSDSFRKRLEQLGDSVQPDRGGVRVANAAVPVVQDLIGRDIPLEAAVRWQETLTRLEAIQRMRPRVPRGLDADLRPYQKEGYRWLAKLSAWGAGGLLADDMGLGKTVQTLGVLLDRAADGPALIVAPTSVGENWLRETLRFAPSLTPHLYRDGERDAIVEGAGPGDLVIVSYALLRQDAARFASRPWQTLVLDEAQYIKNAATKTAQAARAVEANWRLGLSGTPLENHLGELWSLMRTISPGLLGSWEQFRTRFADPIERQGDQARRESLSRLMQPFILRRTKDKVLSELPPRTEVTLFAEMSKAERQRYEAARLAALSDLTNPQAAGQNEGEQRLRVLAWLTRMRQMACHPGLVDPAWKKDSAKLALLLETVEELREGEHRALVFSQFVQHLKLVREALDKRGITYQYLDGSTPSAERQQRVDAFQRGEGELFLISLKAGGTGLNLTAADYVIHLDPWWNPAVEDQATDRAHRIGQSRPVTVFRLVARDTIEEQILALHAEKRELVASVLDGTDRAGRMSTAAMIRLIKGEG